MKELGNSMLLPIWFTHHDDKTLKYEDKGHWNFIFVRVFFGFALRHLVITPARMHECTYMTDGGNGRRKYGWGRRKLNREGGGRERETGI